ncbi:SGNH/GDSL hydrolase family protein [Thermomonas aquatica]|uniref:SGNH/GDSL hydrolase family protein n=1 Tax=Thermomonas aquatica TaxID=2202149 RepID=A0A5B7ZST7_9GAMM|nr:SGNH/GDSL hydrolase family protein [Thermomonas aquatica]QDA57593.1 SGNH/GDSL hydrolase family protein [Thermomonas aquatica]
MTDALPQAQLSYLALGDSYSIGEGVAEAGRWPMQLARALREAGIAIADPRIIATTGWTTDELSAAMDDAEPLGEWDFVSLLIGVNNQYRGREVDDYLGEFASLLQRAIALADARAERVLVLSIPDWGVTPFARRELRSPRRIARELDAYNAVARDACEAQGVAFVDITGISRDGGDAAAMLAEDGLHPSAAMYARWTAEALPVARGLLAEA